MFALLFFFESFRVFVSTIYFDNLATLSINFSLVFIVLIFFTLLSPYLFPARHEGYVILGTALLALVSRATLNLTFPAINVRPDPTPNLLPTVVVSGTTALMTMVLYAKSLHASRRLSTGDFPAEMVLVFLMAMVIDNILVILGGSLDLSVTMGIKGYAVLGVLLGLFATDLLLSYPALRALGRMPPEAVARTAGQPGRSCILLSVTFGLLLFLELALLGSPFIFLAWTGGDPHTGILLFAVFLAVDLALFATPGLSQYLARQTTLAVTNLFLLLFILDIGLAPTLFSWASGSPQVSPMIHPGIFHGVLSAALAGVAQLALMVDLFWLMKRLEGASWSGIQWIIGGASLPLVIATLAFGFTYAYPVLPPSMEILFRGLVVPYMLAAAMLVILFTWKSRSALEATP